MSLFSSSSNYKKKKVEEKEKKEKNTKTKAIHQTTGVKTKVRKVNTVNDYTVDH